MIKYIYATLLAALAISLTLTAKPKAQATDWVNVTPSAIPLNGNAGNNCEYGTLAVAAVAPSRVYLGSCQRGFFRSEDSGATWAKVDTGANSAVIDGSRQWTLAVDPTNTNVIYTNSGYGPGENGAWKSVDGGVNWSRIWPSTSPGTQGIVQYEFVAQATLDPSDHNHLFLSFHGSCAAPYTPVCYAESHDGGATFAIRNGDSRWVPSEAQTIYILDAQRWLFANHADGLWRSSNAGASWTLIDSSAAGHWPSTVYRASNGVYYIGADNGIWRSTDFTNWSLLSVGYLVNGITGDGTTLFAANAGALTPWVPPGTNVYITSPESSGQSWSPAPWSKPTDAFTQGSGGGFAYDPVNHYLFSSNGTIGLWRVRTSAVTNPPPPPPPPPTHTCERVYRYDGQTIYVSAPVTECGG